MIRERFNILAVSGQEVQAELRKEKAAHEVDSRRVQELSNFAEQIQSVKTELEDVQVVKTALKEESTRLKSVKTAIEEESTKLKSDKQELIHRTDMLQRQQAELQVSTNSLRTENQTLAQQVTVLHPRTTLQQSHHCKASKTAMLLQVESLMHLVKAKQEALVALSKHMEAQKAKAISAFKKFAQKEIDGDALLHEFTKLGLGSDVTPYELNALRDDGNMPGNR